MVYTTELPRIGQLRQLAGEISSYPISGLGLVQSAEHLGYEDEIVDFLKLFSSRLIFNSRSDFLDHCSLLERLVKEDRRSPPEHLRSPQD